MFLNFNESIDSVRHEWGHYQQLKSMGITLYSLFVAAPSVIYNRFGNYTTVEYYSKIWEKRADKFGGVTGITYNAFSWRDFLPW